MTKIAFGAVQAGLDIVHGADDIDFTWYGFEEESRADATRIGGRGKERP